MCKCGPSSSVGIATELRAGRSAIESRWGWDFPSVQTGPGAHPASCTKGTGSFPGGRGGRGPRKSRAIPLLTLRAFVACKKGEDLPTFLHKFNFPLFVQRECCVFFLCHAVREVKNSLSILLFYTFRFHPFSRTMDKRLESWRQLAHFHTSRPFTIDRVMHIPSTSLFLQHEL